MTHPLPASLRLLLRLQFRAAVRRIVRSAKTPKGAIFVTVGAVVFLAWLGPVLFNVTRMPRSSPSAVRLVAPLVLLGLCLATMLGGGGDKAISFTAGEVNFLFPGPFTRRDLLFYKLARTIAGGLFAGTILSLVLGMHASGRLAAFLGATLAMWMVQLLAVAVLMSGQAIGERAYSRGRKLLIALIVAGAAFAIAPRVRTVMAGDPEQIWPTLQTMLRSPAARVVFAPFEPFTRTFTAQSAAELALWAPASLAIDVLLLMLVVRLDADYREAALGASQRVYEMAQRVRRGQFMQLGGRAGAARRSPLRMFPWLGGAGPTAWRQLTTVLCASRASLFVLALIMLSMLPLIIASRKHEGPTFAAVARVTMFLSFMVKFDFRGELEQMEWLKALPLGPTATAAGQLAVPVLVLSGAQWVLLGTAAAFAKPDARLMFLAALPFAPAFNLMLLAVDNLLFLLFPTHTKGAAPGDIGQMGRGVVFFLFKILIVAATCTVAGLFGLVAALAAGDSIVAGVIVGYIVLCALALMLVPLVGIAYRRFDPSSDTPG